MPVAGTASKATEKADSIFAKIKNFADSTHIPQQINDVDVELFTNPWFMVPFVALIGWWLFKKNFRDITIIGLFIAVWYVSGTDYMQTLIVDGELQIGKILPIMFGGAAVLGFVVYMFIGRN